MVDKYYLFAGEWDEKDGGFDDLKESGNLIQDLITVAKEVNWDWWHIVDQETMEIIERGNGTY